MSRRLIIPATAILLIAIFFAGSRFWHFKIKTGNEANQPAAIENNENRFIDYTMHVISDSRPWARLLHLKKEALPVAGVTSHHLPTAESFIITFYQELFSARPNITNFVIVGPDHFERCSQVASVTGKDFLTPFGTIKNNNKITEALKQKGAGEDTGCFGNEHSVGVHTTFIKKYFPEAQISALIFSSAATMAIADKLAEALYEKFPDSVIIASIDFSHYQSVAQANLIDSRTEKQIKTMNVQNISLEQMDSAASLRMVTTYARMESASPELITHTNSFELTGNPDNTTGYFNIIFTK